MTSENAEPRPTPPGGRPPARPSGSVVWIVMVVISLLIFLVLSFVVIGADRSQVEYSFFRSELARDNVERVTIAGEVINGRWRQAPQDPDAKVEKKLADLFITVLPPEAIGDRQLLELLLQRGVKVEAERTAWSPTAQLAVFLLAPVIVVLMVWTLMRRTADPLSGGGIFGGFGRSPARRFVPSGQTVTFDDVAGMEHAKNELVEVVEFLKDPSKFSRLGATVPKGVLLMGPPGTGKTLLARAVAGEARVSFFSVNGSEFIQMFVGVGASRVRDLFKAARESVPCLIFIDEIDAVGRVRGAGVGGGHDEREQTLNQILSEMDGFQQNDAIIVLAATNRPDILDPALLRPGRFDRRVTVDRPNRAGRLAILKIHSRKVPLAPGFSLESLAATTIGFSGADLRNLVNEAALHAANLGKDAVGAEEFDYARDKILMGPKREDILTPRERQMTAYHEAGHALLAWLLPDVDRVHKVTIIPRGRALGMTQMMPEEDQYNIGERRLHSQLCMLMGGRVAEKLVFNEYSAGAEDDLARATSLARRMIGHWGMSPLIGPVSFRQREEHPFLGKEMHEMREFSEATARIIDEEVQRILNEANDRARALLMEHRTRLDQLADGLLKNEMLTEEEIRELIGSEIPRTGGSPTPA